MRTLHPCGPLLVRAALFVIVAALLVLFAPYGRETASSIVAVALFVIAVACAGFSTFAITTPVLSAHGETDVSRVANDDLDQKSETPSYPLIDLGGAAPGSWA